MGEMYMPDSPNGGYRPLPKREFIVSLAEDGESSLYIVRPDDVGEAIIRCKDCIGLAETWDGWECERFSGEYHRAEPDGYCAWGVAKDGV